MNCLRCQHENAPMQKFCGECGARLAASCPKCGTNKDGRADFPLGIGKRARSGCSHGPTGELWGDVPNGEDASHDFGMPPGTPPIDTRAGFIDGTELSIVMLLAYS